MRRLSDENLSRRLVSALESLYPGSAHVSQFGLERADDAAVWRHALEHGFAIVSKDADFADRALAQGLPPKVVWIRRGNCATRDVERRLRQHHVDVEAFELDASAPFLSLA